MVFGWIIQYVLIIDEGVPEKEQVQPAEKQLRHLHKTAFNISGECASIHAVHVHEKLEQWVV